MKDFIIFGSCDWDTNWQTQQRLATSLAKSGNRVLFVENTGVRGLKIKDFNRIGKRIKNWISSDVGFNYVDTNITVYHPIFIPFQYSNLITKFNNFFILKHLNNWLRLFKFNSPVIISFLATPLIKELIQKINNSSVIYYCANDNTASHLGNEKFKINEDLFLENADAVFVTSEKLKERALKKNTKTFKFSSAVELNKVYNEIDKYDTKDLNKIKKPIVGFIGSITNNIDQNLLIYLAQENKEVNFVFIGSIEEFGENIIELKKMNNVFFLGKKKHEEIFSYIKKFDLGIIPYKVNQFTDAVYPSKLNEYMACGIPVISTNIYEISHYNKDYQNAVNIANNKIDFSNKIKNIINQKIDKNKFFEVAKKNSWNLRFESIYKTIEEIQQSQNLISKNFKNEFRKQINFTKSLNRKKIVFLILLYITIFVSPVPYFFSRYLTIEKNISSEVKFENILALSGYGLSKDEIFPGNKIVMDLNYYLSEGKINRVYLSGRKNFKHEIKFLFQLLKLSEFDHIKVKIIEDGYSSTYQNIVKVNEALAVENINKINILTDSLHRKRVELIFKKINPQIELNFLNSSFNDRRSIWFSDFSFIKELIYEYSAIVYNKYKRNL